MGSEGSKNHIEGGRCDVLIKPGSKVAPTEVCAAEIDNTLRLRPLVFSESQLTTDFGKKLSKRILKHFRNTNIREEHFGVLNHPGVSTRAPQFCKWYVTQDFNEDTSVKEVFTRFANFLGRVTSYRALAISSEVFEHIRGLNKILPTGSLKTDLDTVNNVVQLHGVTKVAVARLYISALYKMIRFDPSMSLHDDWQTAVCIAGGYTSPEKRVHVFGMSVPLIETLGWRLRDVSTQGKLQFNFAPGDRWFQHRGIWFDGDDPSCERYVLFELPFLEERLQSLFVFDSDKEIQKALKSFATKQKSIKADPPDFSNFQWLQLEEYES